MKIQLDIYGGEGLDVSIKDAASYNLHFTVLKLHGPAGGNPFIQLEGSEENIKSILKFWDITDPEEYTIIEEHYIIFHVPDAEGYERQFSLAGPYTLEQARENLSEAAKGLEEFSEGFFLNEIFTDKKFLLACNASGLPVVFRIVRLHNILQHAYEEIAP